VLLRDLGAPQLPPLVGGQPPAGGGMATVPVQRQPAPNAAPGASNDGAASRHQGTAPASGVSDTGSGAVMPGAAVPAAPTLQPRPAQ